MISNCDPIFQIPLINPNDAHKNTNQGTVETDSTRGDDIGQDERSRPTAVDRGIVLKLMNWFGPAMCDGNICDFGLYVGGQQWDCSHQATTTQGVVYGCINKSTERASFIAVTGGKVSR